MSTLNLDADDQQLLAQVVRYYQDTLKEAPEAGGQKASDPGGGADRRLQPGSVSQTYPHPDHQKPGGFRPLQADENVRGRLHGSPDMQSTKRKWPHRRNP
jgi:hypothetical protein